MASQVAGLKVVLMDSQQPSIDKTIKLMGMLPFPPPPQWIAAVIDTDNCSFLWQRLSLAKECVQGENDWAGGNVSFALRLDIYQTFNSPVWMCLTPKGPVLTEILWNNDFFTIGCRYQGPHQNYNWHCLDGRGRFYYWGTVACWQ